MQIIRNRCLNLWLCIVAMFAGYVSLDPTVSYAPEKKQDRRKARILFIGNSYSYYNNLPGVLQSLATGNGKDIHTEIIARNGASLQEHWNEGTAVSALKNKRWDFVVLQERSSIIREKPHQTQTYARLFQKEIENAGARTLLYVTPVYKDQIEKQAATYHGYRKVASDIDAMLVPVGPAFQKIFDRIPKMKLHASDTVHPNLEGTLLAAYVFYMMIFGNIDEQLKIQEPGIELTTKEETAFHAAVAEAIQQIYNGVKKAN